MSELWARYEWGDTQKFTAQYSAAPTTPYFAAWLYTVESGFATLIESKTMTGSSSTDFYAFHTVSCNVDSISLVAWEICGSYTNGPVFDRGIFDIIKTNRSVF